MFALCETSRACSASTSWTGRTGGHRRDDRMRRGARAINGLLIGYLWLRASIATLITLIIYRSAYDLLLLDCRTRSPPLPRLPRPGISSAAAGSLGMPSVVSGLYPRRRLRACIPDPVAAGSACHRDRQLTPLAYTFRHSSAAHDRLYYSARRTDTISALFFAARLAPSRRRRRRVRSSGPDRDRARGVGLGSGKSSVAKALVGTLIVLFVINGLTTLSVSGGVNRIVLAGVLLVAATINIAG